MKKEKLYTKFGARFEYQAMEHMANNYSYSLSPMKPSFFDWLEYIINIPIFVIKEAIYKIETRERKEIDHMKDISLQTRKVIVRMSKKRQKVIAQI